MTPHIVFLNYMPLESISTHENYCRDADIAVYDTMQPIYARIISLSIDTSLQSFLATAKCGKDKSVVMCCR